MRAYFDALKASLTHLQTGDSLMRINIDRLKAAGFDVRITKEEIDIYAVGDANVQWNKVMEVVKLHIADAALAEYAAGAAVMAIQRAQIMTLCD